MAKLVRTSINIGGNRLQDNAFTFVTLTQNVGWHHTFEIRLRRDIAKGVLGKYAKDWIGQKVDIGFAKVDNSLLDQVTIPKIFEGLITSIGLSRNSETAELVVRGHSPTFLVDDGPNTRSFTDMGLQEMVDSVFSPYSKAFSDSTVDPQKFTSSIPYTVQYKESNFAFIARLANVYGEWMYYDGLKFHFGKPNQPKEVQLNFKNKNLTDFDLSVKAIPTNFELSAYDYTASETLKEFAPGKATTSAIGKTAQGLANDLFPNAPLQPINEAMNANDLKNSASRREEILSDEAVILSASSRNPELIVGAKVNISDDEIGEDYGDYTVISIAHTIGQGGDYTNYFEAIPFEVKTPPLSTLPRPPFCETQLAKVTDVADEDGLGRIKVELFWQTGTGETTPWIRVISPYTGNDKGFYIIPEVGDQVLIAFENNNPDKPYMLAGMYNQDATPEWFDSKNRYKGFKSVGKNQLQFDDKNKHILMSAPSSMTLYAGKLIDIKTGGKENSEINLDAGEGTITLRAKKIIVTASETYDLNSGKEVYIISGDTMEVASKNEIKVETKKLLMEGTDKVETKSKEVFTEATTKSELKSANISIEGSGPVTVKGMPIKLN